VINYIYQITPHLKLNLIEDCQQLPSGTVQSGDTIAQYPILSDISGHALSILRLYLANFYDWGRMMDPSFDDQNFNRWYIHLFIYELYQRVSTNVIPSSIQANYSDTMLELEKVAKRILFVDTLPQKNIAYDKATTVLIDVSDVKINNRQF
jgi:hypothetical protein